jgi:Flp pilus assembly protein TadD
MRTTTLALFVIAALGAGAAAADLPAQATPGDVLLRAQILAARQSWADAAVAFKDAIAASPKDATLHNRLGICYQRMGDMKAARAAYRTATELDPAYAAAHNNLGTLEHTRGKYKKAISAYEKAISIKPKDPLLHKNLGAAWLARGDVEKALTAWGEAVRLDPLSLESDSVKVGASDFSVARQYYLFAKLVAARGEVEKALEYLGKAHDAGFKDFGKIENDRDFAGVIGDPRYATLK